MTGGTAGAVSNIAVSAKVRRDPGVMGGAR